eukprot:TRINITY_DN2063_c0_g1_i4.p1 TRINITY_DN2063_c0_g1~~TRINITY_DN2063_c0_g1_i4.p1  ORF type:complete len:305 (+),score=66.80 TRINITY_DN2063_c0_g1_i4:93-917(+)
MTTKTTESNLRKNTVEDMFDVKEKIVLVSGGGRGIGLMIAQGFVENGAKVIVSSRDEKACKHVSEELTKRGPGSCSYIVGDLSKDEDCKRVAEELSKNVSHLNVLVNNSGANWGEEYEKYPSSAFDKVLALNVKSVFLLTRYLTPLLEKGASDGSTSSVINIGSVDGIRIPGLETYAYSASKAAVHHLTRVMSSKLAVKNIRVNAIAAGPFETKMMAHTLDQFRDALIASVPLGRIGNAQDVAALSIFLASKGASFLTGAIIPLDGGILSAAHL